MAGRKSAYRGSEIHLCSLAAQFFQADDLVSEFRRQWLDKMLESIRKASAIIENLLIFTRPSEKIEITRINLCEVIGNNQALVANQPRLKNIELRWDGPAAPIYLNGLAGLLPQVFLALFLNALTAMPDGGIL